MEYRLYDEVQMKQEFRRGFMIGLLCMVLFSIWLFLVLIIYGAIK